MQPTPHQQVADYVIGGAGASSPAWLQWVHAASDTAAMLAAVGGAILISIRILIALRDLRKVNIEPDD